MNVLFLSLCLLLAIVLRRSGDVDGQLTAPSSPTCPGDTFTFNCTVMIMSGMNAITLWRVNGTMALCTLSQLSISSELCGPNDAFTATPGSVNATSFLSTLSGTADPKIDGILVECFGPDNNVEIGNRVGGSPIQIVAPPSVTLSCAELSGDVSGAVTVTVSWTLSGGDSADFYLINITTNAPQTPYGGLLNITTGSVTQYELTGFVTGYEYNITVRGVTSNCGGLVGRESEPLILDPPSVTLSCIDLSGDVSGAVNVTLSWTLSGGDSADFYLINITTNAPQTPYGGLLNITNGSVTQYELTGFMTGYEYNITVRGVTSNCGGLVGRESEPLTIAPPSATTLSCVDISEDVSRTVNVTVSWTGSGADSYLININTNAPQTPYGGLLNITTGSVTQHELTGVMAGYEYNITVRGVTSDCGGLVGRESEPLTITPQVPATPTSTVCAVYDMATEALQIIQSTWNEVNNVTVSEDCANGRNIKARYELTYITDSGSLNITCVLNGTECTDGVCRHDLQSNTADSRCQPPVSQFSGEEFTVSVTARNIVGRSNSAVSRSISGMNLVDLAVRIDTIDLSNSSVNCTIFQPKYTCTIDYGTDPSYTNLVYRDTSSTQGQTATITLSQRLRGDTTYYYIVSAESNSRCVRERGRFQPGCSEVHLTDQSHGTVNATRCADGKLASSSFISDGVVCYNGTTAGSVAVYTCNNGFRLVGNEVRVCQDEGNWNGSIPQCIPDQNAPIVGSVVGVGVVTVLGLITVVVAIVLRAKRGHQERQVTKPNGSRNNEGTELPGYGAQLRKALAPYTRKAKPTGTKLGSGAYGTVIELRLDDETVAGKMFKPLPQAMIDKLRYELIVMDRIKHSNIVRYKGVCFLENQALPVLLMERLMSNLHDYLLDSSNLNLGLPAKLAILCDVAIGLDHLHSSKPAIIHRDLTARNVLLDSKKTAKIADFGNALFMDLDPEATPKTLTSFPGTRDYMPPEAQSDSAKYDPSLDVFSFGHLSLFTIIQSPIHSLLPSTYTDDERLHARSEVKRREQYLDKAEQHLGEEQSLLWLVKQCLHNLPAQRPQAAKLVTELQDILGWAKGSTSNPSQATISTADPQVTLGCPTVGECIRFQGKRTINIPQEIGVNYYKFGINLLDDHNGNRVRSIEQDYRETERITMHIIQEWANGRGKKPVNWKTLTDVLRDIELCALANEIEAVKLASSQ